MSKARTPYDLPTRVNHLLTQIELMILRFAILVFFLVGIWKTIGPEVWPTANPPVHAAPFHTKPRGENVEEPFRPQPNPPPIIYL